MWSEFFSFLAGCVATGIVVKVAIVIKKRHQNVQSNAQTGSNMLKEVLLRQGLSMLLLLFPIFMGMPKQRYQRKNYLNKQRAF